MKHFAGLDVSLKEISICVIDADGGVVARGTAPSDPDGVAGWMFAEAVEAADVVPPIREGEPHGVGPPFQGDISVNPDGRVEGYVFGQGHLDVRPIQEEPLHEDFRATRGATVEDADRRRWGSHDSS